MPSGFRITLCGIVAVGLLAGCAHAVDRSYIPVDSQLRPWQPPEGSAAPAQAEKTGQKGKK